MEATAMRYWRSVEEIKRANRDIGHHYFDADTMRFFRSRILVGVIGGCYFITSEQFRGSGGYVAPRRYSIRKANADGSIDDVDGFQAYASARQARAAAHKIVSAPAEGGAA